MWFADAGLDIAASMFLLWAIVVVGCAVAARWRPAGPLRSAIARPSLVVGVGLALCLVLAQAVIVDHVADHPAVDQGLDRVVLDWFIAHRSAVITGLATSASDAGDTVVMTVVAAVAVVLLWWRARIAEAATVAVAAAGAGVLVVGFKSLYGRPRPPLEFRLAVETNASLPSGHAVASTVVLGILAVVVVRATRRRMLRRIVPLLVAAAVPAIGVSRLYLGVHWLTDVLVGWLLGGAWLVLCTSALVVWRTDSSPAADAPVG